MLIIKNATIHNAVSPEPFIADILINDGKIADIRENIDVLNAEIYDANGLDIYPGFIDAHTHIGMFGSSGEMTKDDVEKYDKCTPDHCGIDCINPDEPTFKRALEAGVTCVCVGPGSVGCIAGTHAAVKTYGDRIDDMIVKNPVAMKIAFGENPKRVLKDSLTTRMTIAAVIKNTLTRAKEYYALKLQGKTPGFDAKLEALIPVLEKKIPLKAHAHRKDDIFTAIRIAKEFDVNLTLEHVTDGGEIADILAKEGYPIAVGPFTSQPRKDEMKNSYAANAVKMINAGCCVSATTDAPVLREEYLTVVAGLLMREGLCEFEALKTITINAAKHLGIESRVGSIEVGKDADIVITKGSPLNITVKPKAVFINGKKVY